MAHFTQKGRDPSAPRFWGCLSIYACTLCRRTTKSDMLTHSGRNCQPRFPSQENEVTALPNFGGFSCIYEEEEEDFAQTLRFVAWELIPLFGPWSRRGLNPIKPVYNPDRPDGRLNLTASAFNQLGQYTSSPGRRGYCYAELAVFFPSGGHNHRQYSLRLTTEGWPG